MLKPLCTLMVVCLAGTAFGQFASDDRLEPPRTPTEFWRAVNFEIHTGKFDSAAFYLKGFLASNPSEQDLLEIENRDGLASFLRLRNINWSSDAKVNVEAKKNVEDAITRVNAALEKLLGDQQRINRLIGTLRGSEDERVYAIRELQRSGARAIPALVMALRSDSDASNRAAILNILPALPEETVAPLLAALDIRDARVRYQLLQSLGERADFTFLPGRPETNPLPTLDYLAASPKQPDDIRRLATSQISRLRSISPSAVRSAKQELTDAALRFHRHQERFIKPDAVAVWRWDNDDLVLTVSSLTQAEEYFGLRYARWALELDPEYVPAQIAFLSIAADKAYGRVGVAASLEKTEPAAFGVLAAAGTTALIGALDQAIVDRRTNVALAVTQALGERADAKAAQPGRHKPGVLVQALEYPDRRVQLAAAAALVRIPGPYAKSNQTKIVDIFRRALAAETEVSAAVAPRILVVCYHDARGKEIASALNEAGFETVSVRTGRDAMRRIERAGDIDGIALDADVPDPPLPDLLASLRADAYATALPVRVLYSPTSKSEYPSMWAEAHLRRKTPQTAAMRDDEERHAFEAALRMKFIANGQDRVTLVTAPLTPNALKTSFTQEGGSDGPPLTPDERKRFARMALMLFRQIAVTQPGFDLKPGHRTIRQALKSDELAPIAVDVVGQLSGKESQVDLATLVLDDKRPVPLRLAAANNLALHIQRFNPALPRIAVEALSNMMVETKDLELRAQVAAIVGVLTGEGKSTGLRLQTYSPSRPSPEAPPTPEKKPEEMPPEKKSDPDDE